MAGVLKPDPVTELTTSFATLVTATTGKKAVVSSIHVVNCSASQVSVYICVVPSAGSAQQSNGILWNFPVAAGDFLEFGKGMILTGDDTIQAKAGSATSINVKCDIVEEP